MEHITIKTLRDKGYIVTFSENELTKAMLEEGSLVTMSIKFLTKPDVLNEDVEYIENWIYNPQTESLVCRIRPLPKMKNKSLEEVNKSLNDFKVKELDKLYKWTKGLSVYK